MQLLAFVALILGLSLLVPCRKQSQACLDRQLRDNLTEKQVDKMIADSFPASDPPSTY